MALSARLQTRQSQSLVITPQLLQAIRLLQMSSLEIDSFVDAEIEANPLLSRSDEGTSRADPAADDAAGAPAERADFDPIDFADPARAVAGLDAGPDDIDPDRLADAPAAFPGSGATGAGQPLRVPVDAADPIANLGAETSMVSHVEAQIVARFAAADDRCIARHLLAALDACGYLTATPEAVAETLGADGERVWRVLAGCQAMEPTGIFARSLGECLSLQLAERDRLDPAMRALIANLPLLADGRLGEVRRACGVDETDFADMLAELRALDPKPGLRFDRPPVQVIVPDVIVRAGPAGWIVELNEDTLPRVLVDRTYQAEISARAGTETRRFLSDCLQRASWLARSLDQRANTVLKVATEIVSHQGDFLDRGVTALKPLNLRMIADRIGMHESTVSRAAANKYMATPRGIFGLKFFFSSALSDAQGGDDHAAEAVKHRIRTLVDNEPCHAVLSDDAIVALLTRDGIVIARRTVAKYRDMLGLPSSVRRRRLKGRALPSGTAA